MEQSVKRKSDPSPPDLAIVVVDRSDLGDRVQALLEELRGGITVKRFASVLDVLGEGGPIDANGLVVNVGAAGPFLHDLLRWTDRSSDSRVPAAVIGGEADQGAVGAVLVRDHVQWIDAHRVEAALRAWLPVALEVMDLRAFRREHDRLASSLREMRGRLFCGSVDSAALTHVLEEGPPCGPPLPTNIEEILPLCEVC